MRHKLLTLLTIVLLIALAIPAFATDVRVTAEIQSMTQAVDVNGSPYIRIIVNETRTLAGVEYQSGVPVMAFNDMVAEVKATYKAGDILDAICASREYQGRASYTILAIVR